MILKETQTASREIYKGRVVHLFEDEVLLSNGETSRREYVRHIGAVCVIPLTEENEIVLERQFRYPFDEVLVEIPAGKLDSADEDPREAALRELREETGAIAAEMTYVGDYYGSPAIMGERIRMFVARGLTFGEQELDRDEMLEVFTMPVKDAVEEVLAGRIPDGKTQAGILRAYMMLQGEGKL